MVKESPYVEAAQAYGAGSTRIIFNYLIPRIIPLLLPQFVTIVPTFVFLEASLAVLGLGDPILPTWGKVINEANTNGALHVGQYYWVLEPSVLLMFTGLGIAVAFRSSTFNLGGEGQAYAGAIAATVVCLALPNMPGFVGGTAAIVSAA